MEAWNLRNSPGFANAQAARPFEGISWNTPDVVEPLDALISAHPESATPSIQGAPGPASPDLSQYLIGSVAVALVFVEGPTSALKFSIGERAKVVAQVQEGLTWLADQELRANVSWAYDIKTIQLDVAPDPTLPDEYEPLEAHWRNPAMASLGFTSDLQGVRDYVTTLRTNLATDWGYVAFFVKYPLHHFAYAGKPRIVMSYDNGSWGSDNIDRVFTHETGHIFGCSDEYRESGCLCTTKHGYLQVTNGNCQPCALSFVPCLMERNTWALCSFTREHLGWRDSQGDDVLDPTRKIA